MREKMKEMLQDFYLDSTEAEKEALEIVINGIIRKKNNKNGSYLGGLLQARSRLLDNDQYEMTIPNTSIIQNALNIVHGGVTATLLDSAMGSLVHKKLPDHLAAVTTELKINYLAPGTGSELRCVASIIHQGSKIIVVEGKVFRDDEKLMAHATGSFFVINRK